MEFGQFLPDATGGGGIGGAAMKATAALDAARNPDTSRPRPSAHQPQVGLSPFPLDADGDARLNAPVCFQRGVESIAIESESQIYHSSGGIGRAPSPGYGAPKPAAPVAAPQPAVPHRTERDGSLSHLAPSSQAANQHPVVQVSRRRLVRSRRQERRFNSTVFSSGVFSSSLQAFDGVTSHFLVFEYVVSSFEKISEFLFG